MGPGVAYGIGQGGNARRFRTQPSSVSKYFDSKSALLEVGLERHLAAVAEIDGQLGLRRVGDLHSMFVTAR